MYNAQRLVRMRCFVKIRLILLCTSNRSRVSQMCTLSACHLGTAPLGERTAIQLFGFGLDHMPIMIEFYASNAA